MQKNKNVTEIVACIIESIKEKKGEEIVTIDLTKLENTITDYFIICHGNSNRQVDSIAEGIERKLKTDYNEHVFYKEGVQQAEWILLDYFNIVVHVFQKDIRHHYKLEELWADGEITTVSNEISTAEHQNG